VRTHFEDNPRLTSRRVADLKSKTAALERQLSDARGSLERELAQLSDTPQPPARFRHGQAARDHELDLALEGPAELEPDDYDGFGFDDDPLPDADRTEVLVSHGRRNAYPSGWPRKRVVAIGGAAAGALGAILAITLSGSGASWPSSVAVVQNQAARACQNPDVKSEPGQVNFACAKSTRQILWVFALLTSRNNADYADARTGRVGLEPITPTQGGEVAWSLNLHHPYDPVDPVDSLSVAARAINNIIGGATTTSSAGRSVVQPGLESVPANCLRYTGSAAITRRKGFPAMCAKPISSPAGQAALVSDVYQKWIVGAPPRAAQQAGVVFENADNPGDPQVQAILARLSSSRSHS
jgi:hypothetical protein